MLEKSLSKKSDILALSFLIPTLTMLLVYVFLGIYPFGEKSVLWTDLAGQYINFLSYFRKNILEHGNFIYTFSKNGGGDMIGLAAYYLASPLNLLLIFFETAQLPNAVLFLQLLRIGLCGFTMSIYLNRDKAQASSLLFSSSYAMMAYNVVYSPHVMWMDAVIILPIIVFGIERLYKKFSTMTYVISLAYALITNYYIGFMLSIFSLIYFLYLLCFENESDLSFQTFVKESMNKIIRFVSSSILAAGLSAFVLLPVFNTLRGGKAKFSLEILIEAFKPNFPIFDILSKLYLGTFDNTQMTGGLPNIYCGMIVILFCIAFFSNGKIPIRKKIGTALLISAILVTFYIGTFNLIWHGFNYPVWFLYRYSFVFSFLLISTAFQAYESNGFFKSKAVFYSIPIVFIVSMLVEKNNYSYLNWVKIYGSFIFFAVEALAYVFIKSRNLDKQRSILLILCLLDLGSNAFQSLNTDLGFRDYNQYVEYVNENEPIIEKIKLDDDSFYRMEKTYQYYVLNDSMLFKYNGLSHYSSTEKQFWKSFVGRMGLRNNGNWAYYNQGSTVSVDSLFGIKYLLTQSETSKPYNLLQQYGDVFVYQNPYALPLGFMADEKIIEANLDGENLFSLQNNIWSSMVDNPQEELFYPVAINNVQLTNLLEERYENGIRYVKENKEQDAYIEYVVNVTSNDPIYVHFPTDSMRQVEIFLNGTSLGDYFSEYRYDIVDLGVHEPGEQINFKMLLKNDDVYINQALFYHQDIKLFEEYFNELAGSGFIIERYTNSSFEGTISNTGSKKYMLLSIPFEEEWKVKVDNTNVPTERIFGAMMAVEISAGTHSVALEYIPKHLYLGIIITVISGLVFIGGLFYKAFVFLRLSLNR